MAKHWGAFAGSQLARWSSGVSRRMDEYCELLSEPDSQAIVWVRYENECDDDAVWSTPARCVHPIGPVASELLKRAQWKP